MGGAWFELAEADGRTPIARYPRSNDDDLGLALDAARAAERAWLALGAGARHDVLRAAADRLLDAPDPEGRARLALGFDGDELDRHLRGFDAALVDGLKSGGELARGPVGAREGPCFLAPSWGSGWHAPMRTALFALRAGRPVVFAPDGRLACLGDALRDACADLPRGVVQVLHDDGRTLARAAAARADLPTAVLGEERADAAAASAAHVVVARARRASVVVDPALDLDAQVERALDAAIGRARALSGSRSGQVARIVAPERAFSRVVDLVLARVESSRDATHPLPLASRVQAPVLESALGLGLDEGATAVLTGSSGEPSLLPVVFTNVEPSMRVARWSTPCALLVLVRARDLRSAHAAATRLDQEVRS